MKLNQLSKYLLLTFLISWISWGVLIALTHTGIITLSSPLGFLVFGIGGFGPTIAAVAIQEKRNPKTIAKFTFSGNHKALPILLLFCVLLAATVYFSSRELNPDSPLYLLPVLIIAMTFIGGGLEELGWRGIMQPKLEKTLPFPIAVLLTSAAWSVWHLPLWFVADSPQQEHHFAAFATFGLVLSFAMAAIHKKTKCVFYSCIFHGFSNALMSCVVVGMNWVMTAGSAVIITVSLLIWYRVRSASRGKA
jgi:hypothetical protein